MHKRIPTCTHCFWISSIWKGYEMLKGFFDVNVIELRNDFLYLSFFVNYILSFIFAGLWTIRFLVQVHRHWVQFTLARRGYDSHNCYDKPQRGNETGVWMTSCPGAMVRELGYFEKHVSWVLDYRWVELVVYWGPVQLSFTAGQSSWVLGWGLSSWELKSDHRALQISTDRDLKDYEMCRTFEFC